MALRWVAWPFSPTGCLGPPRTEGPFIRPFRSNFFRFQESGNGVGGLASSMRDAHHPAKKSDREAGAPATDVLYVAGVGSQRSVTTEELASKYSLTAKSAETRIEDLEEYARRKNGKILMQPKGAAGNEASASNKSKDLGSEAGGDKDQNCVGCLGLFQGMPLHRRVDQGEPSTSSSTSSSSGGKWDSAIAYCGGPVWALDWLGTATLFGEEDGHQIVAVAGMPEGYRQTTLGMQLEGSNVVQIWSMGRMSEKDKSMKGSPQLVMLIPVPSPVVHALSWCRWKGTVNTPTSLGLLCLALGDGSVLVLSVPHPEIDCSRRAVEVAPVASLKVDSDRGLLRGHATCVSWGPSPEESGRPGWAAIGCTTGEVFLLQVTDGDGKIGGGGEVATLTMDEGVSIFSIVACWGGSKHDWESGVFVCTGCADGRVRIWDVDKHHCPVYVHTVLRKGWVTGLAWVGGDSRMLVCVTENGVVMGIFPAVFGLEAKYRQTLMLLERPGHFWDAQVTKNLDMLMLASGEGGVVGVPLDTAWTNSAELYNPSSMNRMFEKPFLTVVGAVSFEPPLRGGRRQSLVIAASPRRTRASKIGVESIKLTQRENDKREQSEAKAVKKAKLEDKEVVTWQLPSISVGVHRVRCHPEREGLVMWSGHCGIIYCCFA